jgi:hypothetical protein
MTEQKLLLGVNVSTSAAPGSDPVADARNAEDLGFDFVSASDHPGSARPSYETWTLLAWIAAATRLPPTPASAQSIFHRTRTPGAEARAGGIGPR